MTEDMTMVPPYNNSELHAAGSMVVGSHNLEKAQPYFLANQLTGAGNSGAVLYLQHIGLRKITHLTNKFYLQALDITRRERVQILETFGAPVASFFGESAKVYNFSGVALDADTTRGGERKGEYFHGTSLLYLYDNFMRGTKLIENNSVAIMQVNNHSIYGYPLQFSYRALSELDKAIQFSFSMFVKDHVYALPGAIDTPMMKKNVGLQNVNNAQADALENLRDLLAPVITTLKYRQDSRWLEIQKEATSASENIAVAVEAITGGEVTTTDVTAAGDAIKAARSNYEAKANDYVTALINILPDPPNAAQRSYFGLTGQATFESVPVGTGSATEWRQNASWSDFVKTDLNIA